MEKIRPIQGGQVIPGVTIPPNNVSEECICVTKIYDWVVSTETFEHDVLIPNEIPTVDTGPCSSTGPSGPTCLELVTAAITNGASITIEVAIPEPLNSGLNTCATPLCADTTQPTPTCTIMSVLPGTANLPGVPTPVDIQCVTKICTVPVCVTVFADGVLICTFTDAITLPKSTIALCAPGATADPQTGQTKVFCCIKRAFASLMGNLTVQKSPCCPIPLFTFPISITICEECQVEANVKLEILGKFCQPRPPLTNFKCISSITPFCPTTVQFPQQCPLIFPGPPNCTCQGAINFGTTTTPTTPIAPVINGSSIAGTFNINATICPDCNLRDSTLISSFSASVPAPSAFANFIFTVDPFSLAEPTCVIGTSTSPSSITITGSGTVAPQPSGALFTANFILTLTSNPVLGCSFVFTLTSATETFVLGTPLSPISVPCADLVVNPCITFPPLF